MATPEDRQHAEKMLYEYQRRLRIRERQKARQGDNVDPAIENEVEDLRLNIAMLEPVLEPEPAPEVTEIIRRHLADDYLFVFRQVVKVGERLTKVDDRLTKVEQSQTAAQTWRLDVSDRLAETEASRIHGQRRNFRISIGNLVLLILLVLALWIILSRAGLL
jgi:hypothetical protein